PKALDHRAVGHHAALRHDHDPVADEVAVAVLVALARAVDDAHAAADARVLVDDRALDHALLSDPDGWQALRLRAVDLLQALVVVGAQHQAVADLRSVADAAPDPDHRALDLRAHQDAALRDERALE